VKYLSKVKIAFSLALLLSFGVFSNISLAAETGVKETITLENQLSQTEKLKTEKLKTEKPQTEKAEMEKSRMEKPEIEKPETGTPKNNHFVSEQNEALSDKNLLEKVDKDAKENEKKEEKEKKEEVISEINQMDYIPILAYHHFVEGEMEPGNGATLSVSEFESQVQYFLEQGYTYISLEELNKLVLDSIDEENPAKEFNFDKKYICQTIDDGYRSNYVLAYPLLKKYNVKADISVITSRIHSAEIVSKEILKLCWSDLDEMQESGLVQIYNHTNDHIRAEEKFTNAFLRSVEEGEKDLNQKLKTRSSIKVLTYPNGGNTLSTRAEIRRLGYALQLTTDYGVVNRKTSVAKIPRITVSSGMTGEDVMGKITAAAQKSFSQ